MTYQEEIIALSNDFEALRKKVRTLQKQQFVLITEDSFYTFLNMQLITCDSIVGRLKVEAGVHNKNFNQQVNINHAVIL